MSENHAQQDVGGAASSMRRRRIWPAAVVLAVPAAVVLTSGVLLRGALPEQLAFHWDASGRPDGTVAASPLFWACLLTLTVVFVIGFAVALIPNGDRDDIRMAMTVIGCVLGIVAAIWLVPAITSYIAERTGQDDLGGWLLLFLLGLGYGGVTRWATPAGRKE